MQLTNATFEFIETLDEKSDVSSLIAALQALIGNFGMGCFLMRPAQCSRSVEYGVNAARMVFATAPYILRSGWAPHA
jgi:hypothetical protein